MVHNVIFDDITGEVLDKQSGVFVSNADLQKQNEEKERRKNYFDHQNQKGQLRLEVDNILGQFYFINYKRLLGIIDNDTALAFRYLYLCTFANDVGQLYYKDKQMRHKDVVRVLYMNNKIASAEVNRMIEFGLLLENNGYYSANLYYYIRNIGLPDEFKSRSARIFDNGIKSLYEISTARHHKTLGEIVPLLEYINKYNNVICSKDTIEERDFKKIKPLNMGEICTICERSNSNRILFKQALGKYKINGLPLLRSVVEDNQTIGYVINPYVLYMGSRNDDLQFAFSLFDLKRR